jgi:septum site-determining protein MinD
MTRLITFTSGKGGVGKTTIATNIAAALHKFGKDVILVDGNISTPNVSVLLGMPKVPVTLHDVLAGKSRLDNSIYIHPSGLKVIPAGLSVRNMKLKLRKKMAKVLNDLIGETEFALIDSAAGLGNEARQAIEAGDEMVLITNPEIHALTDALKAYEFAKEIGIKPLGVILNRVNNRDWEMTKENVEEFLELPVIGMIPEDENVKRSIAMKQPLVYAFPHSPASRAIKKLAARMIGEDYRTLEPETITEKILRIFGFYR